MNNGEIKQPYCYEGLGVYTQNQTNHSISLSQSNILNALQFYEEKEARKLLMKNLKLIEVALVGYGKEGISITKVQGETASADALASVPQS